MTTWISVPRSAFSFTKGSPRYFRSSQGVRRGFCEYHGSTLTYESERVADEVHLYAESLLDATAISPSGHVFVAEQLPRFEVFDDLHRFAATSRGTASQFALGRENLRRADMNDGG
jgi:hypothetical protein